MQLYEDIKKNSNYLPLKIDTYNLILSSIEKKDYEISLKILNEIEEDKKIKPDLLTYKLVIEKLLYSKQNEKAVELSKKLLYS